MKRLHVFVMLMMACFWVLSGSVQAQTTPPTFCIGNLVWNDLNKNGIQDPGEPGIPDVTVELYSCQPLPAGSVSTSDLLTANNDRTPNATTVTDINGNYSFGNLPAGWYFVKVIVKEGWAVSPIFQGTSDEKDSDIFPYLCHTGAIHLEADGQTPNDRLSLDAGLFEKQDCDLISIGDMIFNDCNHNGVQDCDEVGIAGVEVEIYACDILPIDITRSIFEANNRRHCCGVKIAETITDLNGHYEFTGLLPGQYCIKVELHRGFKGVFRPGCPDECNLNEFNTTGCMTFNACTKNMDIDFAVCHEDCDLAGLGDLVWLDANEDALQTMNEHGMKGIKATLYKGYDLCDGEKVGSVTTDDNGKYLFSNLIPGHYFVRFDVPYGYLPTGPDRPSDDNVDSDIITVTCNSTNYYSTPVLDVNDVNLTVDAGFYLEYSLFASVGDKVWRDDDLDGVQDPREVGMAGVTVQLYSCSCSCAASNGDDVKIESNGYDCKHTSCKLVATTKTNDDGEYLFDYIKPGHYCLKIVPPPCYALTKYHAGNDWAKNSDFDPSSKTTHCLKLDAEDYIWTIDAGLIPSNSEPGFVGDLVWEDANKNGIQDCGEKGICGVTVELHACDGGATVATTTTDADGKYLFENVPTEATYFVKFILPGQFLFTTQDADENDALDSDPCPDKGITANFTLTSGLSTMIIDAGMFRATCTVSDIVYVDKNNNGKMDADESGLGGVDVELYACSEETMIQSVKTDGNGRYTFNNVLGGSYYLKIAIPAGYVLGTFEDNAANANFVVSQTSCFDVTKEGIDMKIPLVTSVESRTGIPTAFEMDQNFPNPFNPSTTIRFGIPEAGMYTLKVYNMLGQEVATLLNGELSAGYKDVVFDASKLSSGVYIYRLTGTNVVITKKMMLNK